MKASDEWKVCSVCQNWYTGFGNNAQPINDGRCCDECNRLVLVARINRLHRREAEQEKLIHG